MAEIIINDDKLVKGMMSINRQLDLSKNPPMLTIAGQLQTHRYFDEITSIESERYRVKGVTVFQESFGSDDFNIIYSFLADSLEVINGETNLTEEEIRLKEIEIYEGGKSNGRRTTNSKQSK
jgi:hypothetical protein